MKVRDLINHLNLLPPDAEVYGSHAFDPTGLELYAPAKVAFPSAFDDGDEDREDREEQGLPEGDNFVVIHAHTWGGAR